MAWRRKCLNSSRARRPCARHRLPVRSNSPFGQYSSTSSTRVRLGPSSVKLTAPSTWPLAPVDRHTMCESGTCSMIVACQVRRDQKTFAVQFVFSSDSWSTVSTFFMKLGKSANCVQVS